MRVDENKYKEKEKEKRLTWSDASVWEHWRADTSWTRMTVKTKKNLLVADPGRGWLWMQMVDGSGGDDSARVSLYLEILCEFAQPHITNLLPNISISVKY